jgi:hypothetical protein
MPTPQITYPQKTVTANYTLDASDADKLIRVQCDTAPSGSLPIVITVPPNVFADGDVIGIMAARSGYGAWPCPVKLVAAPGFIFYLSPEMTTKTEIDVLNSGFVWFMVQDSSTLARVYDHSGMSPETRPYGAVRLDGSGRLPQVDGSRLVNLPTRAVTAPTGGALGGVHAIKNRNGYYLAGLEDNGNFIVQPFPKAGCCGDTGGGDDGNGGGGSGGTANFQIPVTPGVPTSAPADGAPNVIYDNVNNNLYVWDTNPPPARWTMIGGNTSGGGGTTPSNPNPEIPIVDGKPTAPPATGAGNVVWDSTNGQLWIWNGTAWVTHQDAMTPNAPAGVGIGTALPATGKEGEAFFNTQNSQLYIWSNGAWVHAQAAVAPNAPNGIRYVATLPALPNPDYINGDVVVSKSDNRLWENKNGTWTELVVPAHIAAGSITAGQIAAGSIGASQANIASLWAGLIATNQIQAGQIAAGAITGTEIRGGAITADKFAANAITVGTAQIADASITTLKVAGEAINVIRSVDYQATMQITPGLGSYPASKQELLRLNFFMPQAGKIIFTFSANIVQFSPPPIAPNDHFLDIGAYWIELDGVSQIGWFLRDVNCVSTARDITAGAHTFTIVAFSTPANLNAQIGNMNLVVHGAMR